MSLPLDVPLGFPSPEIETPKLSNNQRNSSVGVFSILLTLSYYVGSALKLDGTWRICICEGKGVCRAEKICILVQVTQLGRGQCGYGSPSTFAVIVLFPGTQKSSFVHFNNLFYSYLRCPHFYTCKGDTAKTMPRNHVLAL